MPILNRTAVDGTRRANAGIPFLGLNHPETTSPASISTTSQTAPRERAHAQFAHVAEGHGRTGYGDKPGHFLTGHDPADLAGGKPTPLWRRLPPGVSSEGLRGGMTASRGPP